jgi:hypothetical protein
MFSVFLLLAAFAGTHAQLNFTTCGSNTCTVSATTTCTTYPNIPTTGACQSVGNGLGINASLANSPPFGFSVSVYQNAACTGIPFSTVANLQATGVSGCAPFAGGAGAYASVATGYIELKQWTGTTCSGTLLASNVLGPQNCVPTPGASTGNSYQINCGNVASTFTTSALASVSYFTSADCSGTATSTGNSPPANPSGCTQINAAASVSSRCVSGATYTTPSGSNIFTQTSYSNGACPVTGLPTSAVVYQLNQCLTFNDVSSSTVSCNGGSITLKQYPTSNTCSAGSVATTVS